MGKLLVRFQVTEHLPPPARNVLSVVQAACKLKRGPAQKLIHDGFVSCRSRVLTQPHFQLKVGDEVEIDFAPQPVKTPAKKGKAKSGNKRFEVVHDDEHLLVVNKPAGLLTVPSPKRERNHLRGQIQKWLDQQRADGKAICVHRLDRGVSGLLVFAKNDAIAQGLIWQFSIRPSLLRQYAAIVAGALAEKRGTFESYLATDEQSLNRFSVSNPNDGELAITHYRTKEEWRGATLVQVQLETGRRNQIRVHFAEQGHPIIGDPRYRPDLAEHPNWPHRRLALHAETLGFNHPATGEPLMFKAPWPQEFRDLRRKLKST
ncbi:MAG: RluA family pseudouridine synthase [Planctomycetota bacterium]